MNFYESYSNIWFICRFYSLHFFINHKNELKITKKSFLTSSIPATLFFLTLIFGYKFIRLEDSDIIAFGDPSSILFIVSILGIISQHFNCFVILFSTVNHRYEILNLYTKLYELDADLKIKLNIKFDYKKMKKKDSRLMIALAVIYISIAIFINYFFIANLSYFGVAIIFNYINGSEIVSSFEYYYLTKVIKYRFNSITNLLTKSIESSKIIPSQLEDMIQCHISINHIITNLNKIFGFRKLFGIANDFFLIFTQFYAIFVVFENRSSMKAQIDTKNLIGMLTIPYVIVKVLATAISCQEAVKAQKNFGKFLKTFQNNENISDLVKLEFSLIFK